MPSDTRCVIFPFDLFGSSGAGRGAELLADALRELKADIRHEQMPTRAQAYRDHLSLREVNFAKMAELRTWRQKGSRQARRVLAASEFLLWISGNHLGVLPVLEEVARRHPRTLAIQLDAHLDIYNLSDCTAELSHGNFLLHSEGPLPVLVNVGHREQILPQNHIATHFAHQFPAAEVAVRADAVIRKVQALCRKAPAVFLDLDCDVFDSAFFPALTHPQPFGLSPHFVLRLLDAIWSERVVGLAISEFDPARDQQDRSLALLMWLLEHLLLRRYEAD